MGEILYFGKTPNESENRNNWLIKNRDLLLIALFWEWHSKEDVYGTQDKYLYTVLKYKNKVWDSRRNSFRAEELREIILILGSSIEDLDYIKDNDLVDYMYLVTEKYIKRHEKEQGMINLLSSRDWIFDEVQENDQPKEKLSVIESKLKRYPRNHELVIKAINLAEFKCEFNDKHEFFTSETTSKNYVEGHHLIPLQFHEEFNSSLDVLANIVSLCVVCHKKLHYGLFNEKQEILEKLLELRITRLKNCNLEISQEKLFKYYKSELIESM
jgi:hypothetical protein